MIFKTVKTLDFEGFERLEIKTLWELDLDDNSTRKIKNYDREDQTKLKKKKIKGEKAKGIYKKNLNFHLNC